MGYEIENQRRWERDMRQKAKSMNLMQAEEKELAFEMALRLLQLVAVLSDNLNALIDSRY